MKKCFIKEFRKMYDNLENGHNENIKFNGKIISLYDCNEIIRFYNNIENFTTISKNVYDALLNTGINIKPSGIGYKVERI